MEHGRSCLDLGGAFRGRVVLLGDLVILLVRSFLGIDEQRVVLDPLGTSQRGALEEVRLGNDRDAHLLDLVGVRDVVDDEGLENVFEVLRKTNVEEPSNWSRRYKANLEKLHSGNVLKVAEVVRDLWRRERDRGLSAGEKRMLSKARQILVSELALAKKVADDRAEEMLDEVLAS